MSVRNGLLAILNQEPTHGYGLKTQFEESTGGAWPLNVGQVYSTLQRLERDDLVEAEASEVEQARRPWSITEKGREALAQWLGAVPDGAPARDELVIKVLLAIAYESLDAQEVIHAQRRATMERLQEYTARKRDADPVHDLPWILLLDALILRADAEARWLDRCDEHILAAERDRA